MSLSQSLVSSKQGYKNWVKNHGPEPLLPGLNMTNEQLLFVSFGQVGVMTKPWKKFHLGYSDSTAHTIIRCCAAVETGIAL